MNKPSERRKGHSKLVYNKTTRTIDAVDPHPTTPPAPMPEPVAWRVDGTQCGQPAVFFYYKQNAMLQGHIDQGDKITPLYAAPMPERSQDQEALLEFFKWAMREGPWDGCDLDGAAVQNKAEALGLIIKTQYNAEKHGVQSDFETGDDWFEYAPHIKAPMPEREGMREALIEQCAKRAENYFENYELANPVARGNVKAIGKKIADDIRSALAPHDKTEG